MSNSNSNTNSGIGTGGALFLVFLTLKLTNHIDWSWWWVTSPLWIPVSVVLVILFMIGLMGAIDAAFKPKRRRR